MSRFLLKKWMTILLSGLLSEANLRVVNSASHCSSSSGGTPKARYFSSTLVAGHMEAGAVVVIRSRVTGLGVTDAQIDATGDTLTVTVPGDRPDEVGNLGQTGRLYIRPVVNALPVTPTRPAGPGPTGPAREPARPRPAHQRAPDRRPNFRRQGPNRDRTNIFHR